MSGSRPFARKHVGVVVERQRIGVARHGVDAPLPQTGGPGPLEVDVGLDVRRFGDAIGEIGERPLRREARDDGIVQRHQIGNGTRRNRLDDFRRHLRTRQDARLDAVLVLRLVEGLDAAMDHVGLEIEDVPQRDRLLRQRRTGREADGAREGERKNATHGVSSLVHWAWRAPWRAEIRDLSRIFPRDVSSEPVHQSLGPSPCIGQPRVGLTPHRAAAMDDATSNEEFRDG